jgi:hypothetical protein
MAAPTLAKVADSEVVFGNKRTVQYLYTGNAAYTVGGDAMSGFVPLRNIAGVDQLGQNTAGIGVTPVWNFQTQKLQLISSSTGAEFSGNASTFQYTLLFISGDD